MRNLGDQHCLTSDDDSNSLQANEMQIQEGKKRKKRETKVSLGARSSLRDNISDQVHIL